ncbi:MAG: hypothetical protein GC159_15195 [Phycisphaera sp.]|nr:hypothetical protein [Phycisphaera sp.]
MRPTNTRRLTTMVVVLALVCSMCGCGRHEEPAATELRDQTIEARDAAKAAMEADDLPAAQRAAAEAERHVAVLREQVAREGRDTQIHVVSVEAGMDPDTHEVKSSVVKTEDTTSGSALAEAEEAALDAKAYAELTEERRDLDRQINGLKLRAYRSVRGVALKGTLKAMAFAARQADRVGVDKLPEAVQRRAHAAAEFVRRYAGDKVVDAPGEVDWAATADRLDAMAEAMPPRATMGVATSLMVGGQFSFALGELETLDPATIIEPDDVVAYHTLRGVVLRMNGYPRLAHEEFNTVGVDSEAFTEDYGPKMQAGIHMLLFASHIQNGELIRADRELARATRAWPNNPMTVFLTGEKLTAEGEYEKAATSLEEYAAKVGNERLAKRIAEHARKMRDEKGEPNPLLTDPKFLLEMTRHFLAEAAADSPAAAKAQQMLDSATDFGRGLLEKLPGVGPADDDTKPADESPANDADTPDGAPAQTPADAPKS